MSLVAVPSSPRPRRFVLFLLLLAGWFALPQMASAHAVLQSSTPSANATLDAAKLGGHMPIVLTFNSRIDAAHSSISLMAADGKSMPLVIDTKADANVLRTQAAGMHAGQYSLRWQVVAGDGHISRGAIAFSIR